MMHGAQQKSDRHQPTNASAADVSRDARTRLRLQRTNIETDSSALRPWHAMSSTPPPPPHLHIHRHSHEPTDHGRSLRKRARSPPRLSAPTFDPWNACTTGHQRAENNLASSTAWKKHRQRKINSQFLCGADDAQFDKDAWDAQRGHKKWQEYGSDGRDVLVAVEAGKSAEDGIVLGDIGEKGQLRLSDVLDRRRKRRRKEESGEHLSTASSLLTVPKSSNLYSPRPDSTTRNDPIEADDCPPPSGQGDPESVLVADEPRQIFRQLTFYINGSTMPYVSDHKLKSLITTHGGQLTIGLARRSVTHVIVGRPASAKGGTGGGLASRKLQKEIASLRGEKVHFVSAEWVLESIEKGIRLSEAPFCELKVAQEGQPTIRDLFKPSKPRPMKIGKELDLEESLASWIS